MALDGGYGARNGAKDAPINRSNSSGVNINIGEDFPILCETCLGPNPYVRMVKLPYGSKLCKISNAPYQSFRWKAGPAGRYKETIICYTVAKERNICQTCLNDMQFGLPVGVRDKILKKADSEVGVPRSIVGSQYFYEQQARMVDYATPGNFSEDQQNAGPSRDLQKFSKTLQAADSRGKTAFRNLPKLCSFWVGGVCSRVLRKSCPFRPCCGTYLFPELAATHRDMCSDLIARLKAQGPDAVQKSLDKEVRLALKDSQKGNKDDAIKKRVFGEDDLTNRYLGKMKAMNVELPVPEDASICTLWVGNVDADIVEQDIYNAFFSYGAVVGVHMAHAARCAFVEMESRQAAEFAAKQLHGALVVQGRSLTLNWARPRTQALVEGGDGQSDSQSGLMLPPPGLESAPMKAYCLPGMEPPVMALSPPLPPGAPPPRPVSDVSEPPLKRLATAAEGGGPTFRPISYESMNPNRMGAKYG